MAPNGIDEFSHGSSALKRRRGSFARDDRVRQGEASQAPRKHPSVFPTGVSPEPRAIRAARRSLWIQFEKVSVGREGGPMAHMPWIIGTGFLHNLDRTWSPDGEDVHVR